MSFDGLNTAGSGCGGHRCAVIPAQGCLDAEPAEDG
jgi:hypothetical protein